MRRFAAMLVMVASTFAAPLAAQATHPDFSGKWTLDAAASGAAGMGVSATVTITQTEKTMKADQQVSGAMGNQSNTLTFNLDGSPSKNSVSAQGMTLDMNSTAAWEGSTLVVTTTADVQGQSIKTVDHYSLDSTGKIMTISTDLSAMGQSTTRKQIFNKA